MNSARQVPRVAIRGERRDDTDKAPRPPASFLTLSATERIG